MRQRHRKKYGLGGLELERCITSQLDGAVDPSAVLRAIERRHRLLCDVECASTDTQYWPGLCDWVRKGRYLDPDPPHPKPAMTKLEAMIRSC